MKGMKALLVCTILGAALACRDVNDSDGPPGFAQLRMEAVAPPSLSRFAPALVISRVVITVDRPGPGETSLQIARQVAPFSETTNQLSVSMNIAVSGQEEVFVNISYQTADSVELFRSSSSVVVQPGRTAIPEAGTPSYVGPGANIAFMSMNGDDTTVSAGDPVQFDVTARDSSQLEVTNFYLTWSTDDPRITVSPRGLVQTRPGVTQRFRVYARTPTGVETSNLIFVQGNADFALDPDSVELRPGDTQSFQVTVSPDVGWEWTVNDVVGGDSAHGFIDDGFYSAPVTPLPGDGTTLVCVRNPQIPTSRGCARVVIPLVPSVGADVVVLNDLNIFLQDAMAGSGNKRFTRNLVNLTGNGPRASGRVVWSDRGRNSVCNDFASDTTIPCSDTKMARFYSEIRGQGYSVVTHDSPSDLLNIPSNVRAIFLWLPGTPFEVNEINQLKNFAREGGRIIFIGEHEGYYGTEGIAIENSFLSSLGSQMVNAGNFIDCLETATQAPFQVPNKSKRDHPVMNGVSNLRYACASEVLVGAGDFPLFYDTANVRVLAAVAKISLSPIVTVPPIALNNLMSEIKPARSGAAVRPVK